MGLLTWLFLGGDAPVNACGGDGGLAGRGGSGRARIIPPEAFGDTYSLLAGGFWQWLLSFPGTEEENPFLLPDTCGPNEGAVFYMAGGVGGGVRECTVPSGAFVFFPIINTECSNLEPDPFGSTDEASCLACNDVFYNADADILELSIDGHNVPNLARFRVQSGIFDVGPLPPDNFLGAPEGATGISLADGYYILMAPMSRGEHTITLHGCLEGFGGCEGFDILVTHNITVE